MAEKKERLDILLVNKGIFESRQRAQASIMAGEIFIDGNRVDKCGQKVKENSNIEFRGKKLPYVSRGGLKLEKAVNQFGIKLNEKVCLDIGASTGGFSDCMLQNGARKVYAIDVGYGQFAWKLRVDSRVKCMERTNVRYVKPEDLDELGDFASIDVSFISLRLVVPVVCNLLNDNGQIIALIKPQFEAGREKVGKKGVVREKSTHEEVITKITEFVKNNNLNILNLDYSPITGPEGNIEYLIHLSKDLSLKSNIKDDYIKYTVNEAHKHLNGGV